MRGARCPRARRLGQAAACGLALVAAVLPMPAGADARQAAQAEADELVQPRPFGHVIGDVLVQRLRLREGQGLPPAMADRERLGVWLERQSARTWTDTAGRRWAELSYQVINAPSTTTVVELPAWRTAGAAGTAEVQVPAWPVSLTPLSQKRPPDRGLLQAMQDDRPPPQLATQGLARAAMLAWWATALAAAAWGGWWAWRNAREAASLPFARACRELRALEGAPPAAWTAVHQALDRTAGEVLHASTVPAWLARTPHYAALRADIEAFYAASNARFFSDSRSVAEEPDLRALCQRLRAVERRVAT
jgi:mxaA protein